ncbi:MAG TPA: L-2-hydroxyglutarate oxidase [Candidatus Saccharimonadales bacterium]|nr:L-2-hydroxyglutarate oxidase [Candidatus Saccharimonadales bacterium]
MTSGSPSKPFDCAVIGGGIVGLATARALVRRFPGRSLVVLEKEAQLAAHQTGHNSGVLHSGLYYRPGSAKARLCLKGLAAMMAFCREHGVPFTQCGKVVVAVDPSELPRLDELEQRGRANGVPVVERIGPERLREIEPHAAGIAALHIPSTGIIDFTLVAEKLGALLREAGAEVRTGAGVREARTYDHEIVLGTPAGAFHARRVVNCAGLMSDRVALLLGARPRVRLVPFRGEYFKLRADREHLVNALIYPVPDPAFPFLGVHFTRMARGGVEAGPNAVLAFKREGYQKTDFSPRDTLEFLGYPGFARMASRFWRTGLGEMRRSWSKGAFTRALQRLLPELREEDLSVGGSGVRAQALTPDGRLLDDFEFVEQGRALHVINAPSPAATASLAIGEEIAARAEQAFGD